MTLYEMHLDKDFIPTCFDPSRRSRGQLFSEGKKEKALKQQQRHHNSRTEVLIIQLGQKAGDWKQNLIPVSCAVHSRLIHAVHTINSLSFLFIFRWWRGWRLWRGRALSRWREALIITFSTEGIYWKEKIIINCFVVIGINKSNIRGFKLPSESLSLPSSSYKQKGQSVNDLVVKMLPSSDHNRLWFWKLNSKVKQKPAAYRMLFKTSKWLVKAKNNYETPAESLIDSSG